MANDLCALALDHHSTSSNSGYSIVFPNGGSLIGPRRLLTGGAIATVLLGTDLERPVPLGRLEGEHRPAAPGAGLGEGLVPDRVIAFGIGGAREEDLAPPRLFFQQGPLVALGAGDAGVLRTLQGFDIAALGIGAAADEFAVFAVLHQQLGAAFRALAVGDDLGGGAFGPGGVREVPGVIAFRVFGAADEAAVAPEADREGGTALGTGLFDDFLGDVATLDVLLGVIDPVLEGPPELFQQGDPVFFSAGDGVELVLQPGGEVVVHVGGEVLGQEPVDDAAHIRGVETFLFQFHVFPPLQGGDDAGVGGGAADAVFFQGLDQGGLGVARRRLGEVLLRADGLKVHQLAFLQVGQHALLVVVRPLGVVESLQVYAHEAGADHRGARGPKSVALARAQVYRHHVDQGMGHLAGQGALPDEFVEPGLIGGEMGLEFLGGAPDGGGPHRLVGLLGVLGLGLVDARPGRQVVGAVAFADEAADLVQGLIGQVDGVGTHVGDEPYRAAADVHALVELLGDAHGALGGEAELARRLLLQGGGDEGGGRDCVCAVCAPPARP